MRPSASAELVNQTQRGVRSTSKGTKTHGMERVLLCWKQPCGTTDSSVEQRLEGERSARPRLSAPLGNGRSRRSVGRATAECQAALRRLGFGSLSRRHRLRLGGPLASTSVRTNSGGRKARAFCEGRGVLIRCWADQEYLGVNARGATAAVTRHGCRRGEVFEGSMRAREGYFGELVRQGTPERSRTPGSGAGCNRPAGSVMEKAAVAERNREGGT
jgi:hypothetical protein